MGSRRKFNNVRLTTINISIEVADTFMKLKCRRETQDDLMKRILAELKDLKEYQLDMDVVLRLKDRQIESLQKELEDFKIKQKSILTI